MTRLTAAFVSSLVAVVLAATPLAAQSLAGAAREEQARRGRLLEPGKAYTNADLTPDTTGAPDTDASVADLPDAAPEAPGLTDEAVGGIEEAALEGAPDEASLSEPGTALDEGFWRRQAGIRRARVDKARETVAALSRPSGGNERQLARLAEMLASAQAALTRSEELWRAFEREAEAAGVPEGWIR